MSIAFPPRVAAAVRGRASVLFVGLSLAALALGGCGQRMAVSVNGQAVSQEQFYRQCANFPLLAPGVPMGMRLNLGLLALIVRHYRLVLDKERLQVKEMGSGGCPALAVEDSHRAQA